MTIDIEKAKARALVERFKKYSDRPDFFGPITEQESDDAIDTITALLAEVERLIAENASIRTLMDCYNLGGWTDSLRLMQERDALAREVDACAAALPGPYYMDPPDGGDVPISEQVKRMARDAARYRWLRDNPWPDDLSEIIEYQCNARWDTAIDEAMKGASDES